MSSPWFLTDKMQARVCEEMREHTQTMTVALSHIMSYDYGEPCGTGTYLQLLGKPYVLTNDHVARFMAQGGIAHTPEDGGRAHRLIHPFLSMGPPVDAAISRVDELSWKRRTKEALAAERIALGHQPVPHELLFIHGFPGERTRWSALAGGLMARSIPYLTQEAPLPDGLDPRCYFALPYIPERAWSVDGKSARLPLPPGFSGSLVWNTRFVECHGENWNPNLAIATGLICMWGQNDVANIILGVRIEIVRQLMLIALREESAYFNWLGRGSPPDDPLPDWVVAERNIPEIA